MNRKITEQLVRELVDALDDEQAAEDPTDVQQARTDRALAAVRMWLNDRSIA